METYIGVKEIQATPMTLNAFEEEQGRVHGTTNSDGYKVVYPDGYVSWSPKEVFEAAYFKISGDNKILEEDVLRFMNGVKSVQIDPKTTLVSCESLTGFTQHETSACVDPNNYDAELGEKYGAEKLKSKYWHCLGFVLQWAKNGLKPETR